MEQTRKMTKTDLQIILLGLRGAAMGLKIQPPPPKAYLQLLLKLHTKFKLTFFNFKEIHVRNSAFSRENGRKPSFLPI